MDTVYFASSLATCKLESSPYLPQPRTEQTSTCARCTDTFLFPPPTLDTLLMCWVLLRCTHIFVICGWSLSTWCGMPFLLLRHTYFLFLGCLFGDFCWGFTSGSCFIKRGFLGAGFFFLALYFSSGHIILWFRLFIPVPSWRTTLSVLLFSCFAIYLSMFG